MSEKKHTILIVDDEASLRKALVFDFNRKGYRVLEAGNGNEAFAIIQREPVDLVMSDIRMPGGDGVDLLQKLRQIGPKPPLIFVSGFADLSVSQAYAMGADAVFSKPFERKALFEAVNRFITRQSQPWNTRLHDRFTVDRKVVLNFPDFDKAVEGRALNFGRGGMFIAFNHELPAVGARISFSVHFNSGPVTVLEGHGVVRWVRSGADGDMPAGVGLEFEALSEQASDQLINVVNTLKTSSYIPAG